MRANAHTSETVCCKRCGQLMPRAIFNTVEKHWAKSDDAALDIAAERDRLKAELERARVELREVYFRNQELLQITSDLEAERDRLKKVLGDVTVCSNCDGSGKNAQGDCCRITGHARECQCTLCQWKNAHYEAEHREITLKTERDLLKTELEQLKKYVNDAAILALLAERDRLKAEVAELQEALDARDELTRGWPLQRHQLTEERDRLRGLLERIDEIVDEVHDDWKNAGCSLERRTGGEAAALEIANKIAAAREELKPQ